MEGSSSGSSAETASSGHSSSTDTNDSANYYNSVIRYSDLCYFGGNNYMNVDIENCMLMEMFSSDEKNCYFNNVVRFFKHLGLPILINDRIIERLRIQTS